ncbi:MAG TPA: sigma-70 family RNA polymerase sigma factor [Sphingobacteriaceae bacterium]
MNTHKDRVISKSDDKLIKQLIQGCLKKRLDDQYKLYKHFYSYALSICLRYAGNKYEAADILNDGFMKAFTNLSKYDDCKPFHLWLRRIMMNTAIDYYRSNLKYRNTYDLDAAESIRDNGSIEHKLDYEDLLKLVQQLPPSYRTVFNLFAIDGYSHEEIALQLGITIGASKSNLFKARQKLQQALKRQGGVEKHSSGHLKVVSLNQYPAENVRFNTGMEL